MAQEPEGYGGYQGYGGYGQPMDPASMRARLAMAMLQQGSDSSPIRSPWQGAARMSQALFGALMMRQMQDSQASSWQKALGAMPTGGGLASGGAPAAGAAPPNTLANFASNPAMVNDVFSNLPPDTLAGAGGEMGPPTPPMAPNNSAGGAMVPGYIGGSSAPGGSNSGGPPPANMTAALPASMQHNMMVAGPGAPSQVPPLPPSGPASGNGPQGAGAGGPVPFNPSELAPFQRDVQGFAGTSPSGTAGAGGGGPLLGRLTSMGYSPQAAAGIIGNFQQESGLNPGIMGDQNTSGGLGQWHGSRFANLQNFAQAQGGNWKDPNVQLAFADKEIKSDPQLYQALNSAQTPQQAALIFQNGFERPAPATANTAGREAYAAQALGAGANSPALAAIQGAAGPPGGLNGPPASMQPNMMVAGPGVPSGARGGNPNMPPQIPPPGAGGGNPLEGLQNMFGVGNPSSPQGGSSPSPAGGGAGGQANDPRFKALTEVLMDPYAAPGAKQLAAQFLNYYMPHPTTWTKMEGTNNLAEQDWMGRFTGRTMQGPHQTSVVDMGTDITGQKYQGVFDKDAPLGHQTTVLRPWEDGGGAPVVPPPSPTGTNVTQGAPNPVPPGNIPPPNPAWTPGAAPRFPPPPPGVPAGQIHAGGSPTGAIIPSVNGQPAGRVPAPGPTQTPPPAGAPPQPQPAATGAATDQPFTSYHVQGEDQLPAIEQRYAQQYGSRGAHMAALLARGFLRGDQSTTGLRQQDIPPGVGLLAQTMAHEADPQFSATVAASRAKTYDAYNNGNEASSPHILMQNANSALSHLGDLVQSNQSLAPFQSNNWGALNGLTNAALNAAMKGNTPGARELATYRSNLEPFVGEMNKFYSGSAGTQQDREDMAALADPSKSPIERGAALQRLGLLLQGKSDELQREWHNSMGAGSADYPLIGPQGQAAIKASVLANVPPDKVQRLLQNPDKAADFDAKYGPGSSRAILGQ